MKTRDDVIKALGSLTRSDREWIIQRLPPTTRFALLLGAQEKSAASDQSIAKQDGALASADPRALIAFFENEPAWIAHAVLSTSKPWREEVRQGLSHSLRQQLEVLDRASMSYSRRVIEFLEQQLAAALENPTVPSTPSRAQELASRIGSRFSRARMGRRIAT